MPPLRPDLGGRAKPLGLAEDGAQVDLVRPGDAIVISTEGVGGRQETSAMVDATGSLHVAAQRDVKVVGLTIKQAEERVADALRQRDRFAAVELRFVGRSGQQVSIIGAVKRPGRQTLAPAMRVADVVAAAGGMLSMSLENGGVAFEWADVERTVVLRDGVALPISMREALRATPGHNVRLRPGDLIYVPFATEHTVTVLGQVNSPGVMPYHGGLRLTEALGAAGGITLGGDNGDIRVIRAPFEKPKVYQASLSAIASGEQRDVILAPGDALFVEDSFLEDMGEAFNVIFPILSIGFLAASFALIFTE